MTLQCTFPGCDIVIERPNPRRKTTMCRTHATAAAARCPVKRAKTAASMSKVIEQPGYREASRSRALIVMDRLMKDPAMREKYRESGRQLGLLYQGNLFRSLEARSISAQRMVAKKLEHIPLEYRAEYLALKRYGLTAAEREAAIQTQVEADARIFAQTGVLPRTGGR